MRCYVSWLWAVSSRISAARQNFRQPARRGRRHRPGRLTLRAGTGAPPAFLEAISIFTTRVAKVLFSGDVGAALLPPGEDGLFVEISTSISAMPKASTAAGWAPARSQAPLGARRVSQLDIDMLCPQRYGAIYRGADVQRFINWFDNLQVGIVGT